MKFTDMVFGYIRQSYLSPLSFGRPTHPHMAPPKHSYIHRLSARLNSPNLHFLAASGWGCCQLWRSNKCSDWGHPLCSYSPAFHLLLRETRNTDVSGRSEHHCSSAATRAQRSRCAVNQRPGRLRFSSFWLARLRGQMRAGCRFTSGCHIGGLCAFLQPAFPGSVQKLRVWKAYQLFYLFIIYVFIYFRY